MPSDLRYGSTDEQIAFMREFREATGRKNSITTSNLLKFVGGGFPEITTGQAMEFLWAQTPLRYRAIKEPLDEVRQEVAEPPGRNRRIGGTTLLGRPGLR